MAQICKDHTKLEISCPADKYFEVLTSKSHLLSKISPSNIQNCDITKGDGKTIGSVKLWKFIPESGKVELAKEELEAIDMPNKSVTFKLTEGPILKYYKDMKATITVTTESGKTFTTLDLEYEKVNDAYEPPTQYLNVFVAYSKDIDSYFSKP